MKITKTIMLKTVIKNTENKINRRLTYHEELIIQNLLLNNKINELNYNSVTIDASNLKPILNLS
jgi:hypothetical protein